MGASSGGVVIAYPHPYGDVSAHFHTSLIDLLVRDAYGPRHVVGHMPLSSGANITTARNTITHQFLTGYPTKPEWLWMVDSDMTFPEDTLDKLLASADREKRPILGGLCFAMLKGNAQEIVPTLYGFSSAQTMVRYNGFPEDQVVQVVGTGAACLLVHRTVFETMESLAWDEEFERKFQIQSGGQPSGREPGSLIFPPPWPWFQEQITGTNWGDVVSEDLTFCLRAAQAGFPIHVDTSIEIGHMKPVVIDKAAFYKGLPPEEEPAPTFITIPVRGKWDEFTAPLLRQLSEQGGYEKVFLFDNAAGSDAAVPLRPVIAGDGDDEINVMTVGDPWGGIDPMSVEVIPAAGKSVYEMWNMGIRESLSRAQRCNIAILNNDLELGDEFIPRMAEGLRAHPSIAAVCGNYDNRVMAEKVQAVKGIAAGLEDGTGGFAGFAFMVRGEVFTAGCPMFNEDYEIWYGDTEFCLNLDAAKATYGIVRDAKVTHLGGGSNTSGDGAGHRLSPEWKAAAARDGERFEAKWG